MLSLFICLFVCCALSSDLMEDIAISYGFNKVPRTLPQCYTTGKYNKLNSVSDAIREQVAQAGFNEVLTWVLLSFDDNYRFMQPRDVQGVTLDIKSAQAVVAAGATISAQLLDKPLVVHPLLASPRAITLANPKSLDFQLVRTTLLPGLLKALANNQGQVNLPIRLFECGDIGFQTEETDVGAKNQRRIGTSTHSTAPCTRRPAPTARQRPLHSFAFSSFSFSLCASSFLPCFPLSALQVRCTAMFVPVSR